MVGAERPGVAFLTCGLDCKLKSRTLYSDSIQLLLLPVVIQRNGQPLPAPAPAVAYALKFDKPILTSRIVSLDPVFLTQSTLRYTGC